MCVSYLNSQILTRRGITRETHLQASAEKESPPPQREHLSMSGPDRGLREAVLASQEGVRVGATAITSWR